MVKTARQKEDGIAKSQGVFLTWLSNDPVLFEKRQKGFYPPKILWMSRITKWRR